MITLGSLFSGSGGFEFAGSLVGIKPIWNAEIEKFPRAVTDARFPDVKQLGDVTQINGAEIEPVDIITFGSPCQDLSIAGKQAGIIDGSRSSLFFQAIRIIKEMRKATNNQYPKFAVWENVRGALSSNKGDDFYEVMQAFASVCEPEISIPRPKKWEKSGWMDGNGWSVAWRLYDAQYWGVPQRRKRIYLIADFASERAGEILFKCESLSGNSPSRGKAWEGTSTDAERSVGGSSLFEPRSLMEENWSEQTVKNALRANASTSGHCIVENCEPICLNFQGNKGGCSTTQDGTAFSLMAMHGHDVHVIAKPAAFMGGQVAKAGGIAYSNDLSPTLKASPSGGNTVPDVVYALQGNGIDRSDTAGCNGSGWRTDQMYTLNTVDRPAVILCQTVGSYMQFNKDVTSTLMARDYKDPQGVCWENDNQRRKYIVRRLTPLECCRLQGFPD